MTGAAADLPLVDHHCHGVVEEPLDRAAFESLLTESAGPGRWHGSLMDSQAGLAVRRVCAPLLDLEPHAATADYLARRTDLGPEAANRRLLRSTGITDLLVDTGHLPDRLTSPDRLADLAGAVRGHEVVRLETVAERLAPVADPDSFADDFRAALTAETAQALAVKSVAAYRVGLDLDPVRPAPAEVALAVRRWQDALTDDRPARLADPVLTRFVIWCGLDIGLPLQLHVGYGDSDIDLHRCDPLLLTPLLRATADLDVPVMLLHTYPFHRSAGYLAQVFDHVFVDIGLAVQGVGVRAREVLAELCELAPFGSVLFSTDAFGLAELYAVATAAFRDALGHLLDTGVAEGSWSAADADRIAEMVTSANARRAYRLGG